jgi:general secretion pathway protein J
MTELDQTTSFPRSAIPPFRSSGFTLLELVISITIIGIIVLIITGATRLAFRSVDAGEKRIEYLERMRSSLWLLNSQIQSEIPLTIDDNGSRKYFFTGNRTFLQFPTNYSLVGGNRGYVLAAYQVASGDRGKKILSMTESGIGMGGGIETRLLDVFDEISFEYFYREPAAEQGTWVQEWTDETSTPEKIRVHFADRSGSFSLLIPMRARGSLAQKPALTQDSSSSANTRAVK